MSYEWSGNIRELKNLIERLALLAPERTFGFDDLPLEMRLASNGTVQNFDDHKDCTLDFARRSAEVNAIKRALVMSNGNKNEAARLLGVSSRTLRYKFNEHGL